MSQPMSLDQVFLVISLSTYVVGALLLMLYFFSRDDWQRNLAIPVVITGCLCQFAQLVARYEITGIWPLLNLYGSLSLFSAMSVAIFIVFAFRYKLWFAGGFVIALAALFLAYALTWNEGILPAVPSLQSYWAKIHVPLVVSSYASFMLAFVLSGLYLVKYYFERSLGTLDLGLQPASANAADAGGLSSIAYASDSSVPPIRMDTPNIASAAASGNNVALWLNTLPSLAQLDVLVYRVIAVGLPLLTIGIITGAWWAKEAWGSYWQWDPKETAALLSWIVYAIYMHLHTRSSFRGVRSAWVSVFGFITIIFCYLGVNIWISGLHSYKM
ncbi:MAG: c-type cytochrome biogenesis protein CcsB [Candidatus Eremiobacteraeota bacterium]|nr:c-type cytochrome biogenesis protein CcsB [Candidatus Eremiobacteraeota bacterium]